MLSCNFAGQKNKLCVKLLFVLDSYTLLRQCRIKLTAYSLVLIEKPLFTQPVMGFLNCHGIQNCNFIHLPCNKYIQVSFFLAYCTRSYIKITPTCVAKTHGHLQGVPILPATLSTFMHRCVFLFNLYITIY